MKRANSRRSLCGILAGVGVLVGALGSGNREVPGGSGDGVTTIILVRHANKDTGSPDPGLSEQGRERARRLAESLRYAGVDTLYASNTARARETAAVVAHELKLDAAATKAPYDPREKPAALAQRLAAEGPGRVVLAVGHSNTVPAILKEMGNWDVAEIKTDEDRDFDHVFIVTLSEGGVKRLICAGYPPVTRK